MDPLMVVFILIGLVGFGLVAGAGRPRDEVRNYRRWESAFYAESHREVHTDATGVLDVPSLRRLGFGARGSVSLLRSRALAVLGWADVGVRVRVLE